MYNFSLLNVYIYKVNKHVASFVYATQKNSAHINTYTPIYIDSYIQTAKRIKDI